MKKTYFFFILLLISNYMYPNKIYKNDEIQISFRIPEDCKLDSQYIEKKFTVKVEIQLPSDIFNGEKQFNIIKNNILNNLYPDIPFFAGNIINFTKINNIDTAIMFYAGLDPYDNFIGKCIIFIKDNKLVMILLEYKFELTKDIKSFDYFKNKIDKIISYYEKKLLNRYAQNQYDTMKVMDQIEKDIKKIQAGGKAEIEYPAEMVELYKRFDELIASLSLY